MKRIVWAWLSLALVALPQAWAFAQTATPTPTPTAAVPTLDYRTLVLVGTVQLFAGPPPSSSTGWLVADGSCVSTVTYARLYAVIGDTFDGCASTPEGDPAFALPDLRGRVPVGSGAGLLLSPRTLGDLFGEETHTLTLTEMPSHTHQMARSGGAGGNNPQAAAGTVAGAFTTSATGGGAPHNNMQPSIVLHFLIWAGTESVSLGGSSLPTPTPLPAIQVYATVAYDGGGQAVAFTYDVRAGELVIALLLLAVLIVLILLIVRGKPVNG